jgi:hypothetical protein
MSGKQSDRKRMHISPPHDVHAVLDDCESVSGYIRDVIQERQRRYRAARAYISESVPRETRLFLIEVLQNHPWELAPDPDALARYLTSQRDNRVSDSFITQVRTDLTLCAAIQAYVIEFWGQYRPARERL